MRHISISCGDALIQGDLTVPAQTQGAVLFAHGSGSGRLSSRNWFVAEALNKQRLATLLIDLLTEREERTQDLRFDIGLLADRLACTTEWLEQDPETSMLSVGYFGASTGAAAALAAAVRFPSRVRAIVSRGGRPDLAGDALGVVTAPTLLLVGSLDAAVLDLNRLAAAQMHPAPQLTIVPGASHLFEEPGTLAQVANLASEWFVKYL